MIRESITVDQALEVLNRAVEADREAIQNLMDCRVCCNDELASDPEIQVGIYHIGKPTVGVLGLLNGLFGEQAGWGAICAFFEYRCSSDESHGSSDGIVLHDRCPICQSEMVIGKLIKFGRSPAIK